MYALHMLTWVLIGLFIATLQSLLLRPHNRLSLLMLTAGLAGLVGGGFTLAAGAAFPVGGAGAASMIAAAFTALVALLVQETITTSALRHE